MTQNLAAFYNVNHSIRNHLLSIDLSDIATKHMNFSG
jgi:hypothetical protein